MVIKMTDEDTDLRPVERPLVSIRKVTDVQPIPNRDRIQLATVGGWSCIVDLSMKKDDWCILFEEDAMLPTNEPRYSFLKTTNTYVKDGELQPFHRVQTIKMRTTISDALCMPITAFPELTMQPSEGLDVSKELKISKNPFVTKNPSTVPKKVVPMWVSLAKYIIRKIPMPWFIKCWLRQKLFGSAMDFPEFLKKTDQENIQNLTRLWIKCPQMEFEVSEKIEGESCTMAYYDGEMVLTSHSTRRVWANTNDHFGKISRIMDEKYDLSNKMKKMNRNLGLQGEVYGGNISGGAKNCIYKVPDLHFAVYDIWDIDNSKFLLPLEREKIIRELGIEHVPIIGIVKPFSMFKNVQEILTYSNGKSKLNNNVLREGVVFKSMTEQIHFKARSPEYLILHGKDKNIMIDSQSKQNPAPSLQEPM